MEPAIVIRELGVTFRGGRSAEAVEALREVDLEVAPGRIVALLGPNGSGKTTLLRVLAGLQRVRAGQALVLGQPPGARSLVADVGYQPEGPLPFPQLSACELLVYLGRLTGMAEDRAAAAAERWLERFGLAGIERPVRTFSTGMERRLALAAALLSEPKVLLLDEPTAGLDPEGSQSTVELLRERAAEGTAVLLASHHLQEVEQMAHEVAVLHEGRLRARGTLDDLLGTRDRELVLRGLNESGFEAVRAAVREAGGEVLRSGPARRHLFELFRRLRRDGDPERQ